MPHATSPVAKRYAKALFQLAIQQKSLPAVAEAVATLQESLADESITLALNNPRFSLQQRRQFAVAMAKAIKAPVVLANMLGLLAEENRLAITAQILAFIQEMSDSEAAISNVEVQSAQPLSAAQKTQLKVLFKLYLKSKDVHLYETINPELKSGFRAFFGGLVWDTSLAGQIARLKAHLGSIAKPVL